MKETCLSIHAVSKDYEGVPLLKKIELDLHEKETLCLLGPSGSGKSTLLRIIAGLERADEGNILWYGMDISDVAVEKRNFGLMFQDYALFPHMNVAENVAFGPRMRGWKAEAIQERVKQTLRIVRMEKFRDRQVVDLSGGEKQRVALARTIAPSPELLMLDEPLGALDKALRDELGQVLHEILGELKIPTVYVTHDQEEAFTVGDRVAVLNFGKILQLGAPEEIYSSPASLWIAGFLGFSNQVSARVSQQDPLQVSTSMGDFFVEHDNRKRFAEGDDVILVIRPEAIRAAPKVDGRNLLSGLIRDSQFRGDGYRLTLQMEDDLIFHFHDTMRRDRGDRISFEIPPSAILCYPAHEPEDHDHKAK